MQREPHRWYMVYWGGPLGRVDFHRFDPRVDGVVRIHQFKRTGYSAALALEFLTFLREREAYEALILNL